MVAAYLLIDAEAGKEIEVVKLLSKIEGIKLAHVVTGLHDVIAFLEARDIKELREVIIKKIRAIKSVRRTVTCIAVDVD